MKRTGSRISPLVLASLALLGGCDDADLAADELADDELREVDVVDAAHPLETFLPVVSKSDPTWGTTSITYQNLINTSNEVVFEFLDQSGNVIETYTTTLASDAGKSLGLANIVLDLPAGYLGSAIIRSQYPLAATVVQTGLDNRPMYDGFSRYKATKTVHAAPVDAGSTSLIAVQNVTRQTISVAGQSIRPGESAFTTGSAQTRELVSTGQVVGASLEKLGGIDEDLGLAIETVATTRDTTMASAMCRWGMQTNYTLYNPSSTAISVNIDYVGSYANSTQVVTISRQTVQVGGKATTTVGTCEKTGSDFNGNARISASSNFAVFGKVRTTDGRHGVTGFVGGDTMTGSRLVLPYVRWWPSDAQASVNQRTFIAISNTSAAPVDVVVDYYDAAGRHVRQHALTIAAKGKGNTHVCMPTNNDDPCDSNLWYEVAARHFGTPTGNDASGAGAVYGGSAVVTAIHGENALLATARVGAAAAPAGVFDSEDYNGIDASGDGFSLPIPGWSLWQALGHYSAGMGGRHLAHDLGHPSGGASGINAPVYSVAEGRVLYAGTNGSTYKNVVLIEHNDGMGGRVCSFYGHVHDLAVSEGSWVSRGQQIAKVKDWAECSQGGASSNTHLHYVLLSKELCDRADHASGTGVCGYDGSTQDVSPEPYHFTAVNDICYDSSYPLSFISPTQFIADHD